MPEDNKSENKLQIELSALKEKIAILQKTAGKKASESGLRDFDLFESLLQISTDSVIFTDPNGKIISFNDAALTRLESNSIEISGKPIFDFFPYHKAQSHKQIFEKLFEKNKPVRWEEEIRNRWFDIIIYPIRDKNEEPKMVLELARDISTTKKVEKEFRDLVENSLQPLIIYQDKKIVYANKRVTDLFNCTIDDVYSVTSLDNLLEYIHAEDRKRINDIAWKHIERVTVPHRFELRMYRKDQKLIWLEVYTAFIDFRGTPAIQISLIDITERKEADEAFRESEERFKIASMLASDSIYEINLRNHQAKVYSSTKNSDLGTLQTEIMSLDLLDRLIHPEDKARILEAKERLHKEGEPFEEEYRLLLDENKIVYLYSRAHLLRDEDGNPFKEIGVTTDITKAKKAREVIDRERNLFLNGPLAALRWKGDELWPIEYVSQNIEQFGYKPEEFTSGAIPLSKFIHKDDLNPVSSTIQRKTSAGVSYFDHDYRIKHANGDTRWVYDFTIIVRDEFGQALNYESYILDITDRKNIEEALKLSKERYSIALEAGKVIVWDWDLQKDHRYTSSNINSILGLEKEKLSETVRDWNAYVHSEDRALLIKERMKCFDDKTDQTEFKYRIIDAKGKTHWMLSRVVILRESNGKAYRMMGTDTDITQIKMLEQDLQKAKEIAEEANAAKIDFLANMSHDLRIPLNGILGYAQILSKDTRLPSSSIAGLDVIERSGEHLKKLIDDLLEFAKIEAGSIQPDSSNFSLVDSLNKVIEILRISAQEKRLALELKVSSDLQGLVRTDEKILSQIIFNLIDNAIKFTDEGSVILSVNRNGDKTTFVVEDTGIGIPETQLEIIFDPFRRDREFGKSMKGTGLGLTICKRFVEMLGGKLEVESKVGVGSKFSFVLDLPPVHDKGETKKTELNSISGYEGEKKKIMIVDNIEENRSFLVLLFDRLGFDCIEANDGESAIEKARQQTPDLIFIDLLLPHMDGFETVERLRKIENLTDVRIIALTTSAMKEENYKGSDSEFDDYILKPVNIDKTLELTGKYLNIEWKYESRKDSDLQFKQLDLDGNDIQVPGKSIINEFHKAVSRGDITTIHSIIEENIELTKKYPEFAAKVKMLAEQYEIKQLRKFLEQFTQS